jgi:hypothetical protein
MSVVDKVLIEIATKGSIYDEIIDNIIQPNFNLKPELISELAISFLENQKKVGEVIKQGYFLYYFIRAVKNNVHSNTSPFYKNTVIKDTMYYDNIEIVDDEDQIDNKMDDEEKYILIDKFYTKIPKTYIQEFFWQEYYSKGKTYRQIANENENVFSHCLVFHEVTKIKKILKQHIDSKK